MKIVNVKPIITPYTNPGTNIIHHTSLYRFDLETNVDLLEHELILHPTKLSGRTLYCSTKFIVNLKDNISSTTFVDYKDPGNIIYQSENKKNTGVIFFGTGGNAHKIKVEDDERYVLMGSILLYKHL
jgi:hypothetical protein